MGLLDGLLGGAVGAEMVTVVNGLIEKHGGVQVGRSDVSAETRAIELRPIDL